MKKYAIFVVAVLCAALIMSSCGINSPKVKSGEFKFSLEYKLNGEKMGIDDTLMLKYKRSDWSEGDGKFYPKWTAACKNDNDYLVYNDGAVYIELFSEKNPKTMTDYDYWEEGIVKRQICYSLGLADYLMGVDDEKGFEQDKLEIIQTTTDGSKSYYSLSPEEIKSQLKIDIEILSVKIDSPISNK